MNREPITAPNPPTHNKQAHKLTVLPLEMGFGDSGVPIHVVCLLNYKTQPVCFLRSSNGVCLFSRRRLFLTHNMRASFFWFECFRTSTDVIISATSLLCPARTQVTIHLNCLRMALCLFVFAQIMTFEWVCMKRNRARNITFTCEATYFQWIMFPG